MVTALFSLIYFVNIFNINLTKNSNNYVHIEKIDIQN